MIIIAATIVLFAPTVWVVAYVAARGWFRGKFDQVRRTTNEIRQKAQEEF